MLLFPWPGIIAFICNSEEVESASCKRKISCNKGEEMDFSVLTEASQLFLLHIVVWWQPLCFRPKQTTTISHLTQNTSKTGSWYLENSWSRTRLSSRNQFWWLLEREKHGSQELKNYFWIFCWAQNVIFYNYCTLRKIIFHKKRNDFEVNKRCLNAKMH